MNILVVYALLLKATLLSFSGFASVPVVRGDFVVTRQLLTDQQLNDAIAISQASPGPLGIYVVIVGYLAGGVFGAVAGMLALATPALLAAPILRAVQRGGATEIRGACAGIVIVSCVLMLITSTRLIPEATPTPWFAVVAGAALIMLATTRLQPVFIIVATAALGMLLR